MRQIASDVAALSGHDAERSGGSTTEQTLTNEWRAAGVASGVSFCGRIKAR